MNFKKDTIFNISKNKSTIPFRKEAPSNTESVQESNIETESTKIKPNGHIFTTTLKQPLVRQTQTKMFRPDHVVFDRNGKNTLNIFSEKKNDTRKLLQSKQFAYRGKKTTTFLSNYFSKSSPILDHSNDNVHSNDILVYEKIMYGEHGFYSNQNKQYKNYES